ncbi:MAG TPA: 50S ribosomal protein L29 [Terriglobia bacterium]|jgi:large subunit ribosomal protein L29|nr:50S ribosomal protein L29 [Terriglobia bacterium]
MPGAKRRGAQVKEFKERLRDESPDEVRTKERELRDQLFRLKFQFASGQNDVLEKMRQLRRDIARVKTIARERATTAKA